MQSHLEQCRHNMVEQQVRPWDVLDDRVLDTLQCIARDLFVPEAYKNLAYADTAIPLNDTQSMMHPVVEGRILQALAIQPEDDILEIGTGSGYLSACLAHLGSHVDSFEIDTQLAQQARSSLQNAGYDNVAVIDGNGLEASNLNKRYDAIAVTGSVCDIPDELKLAMNIGGRMFIVSGNAPAMQAHILTRTAERDWSDIVLFETVQDRLVSGEKAPCFEF